MQVAEKTHMDKMSEIRMPVIDDLKATDELICTELLSNVPLIQDIARYIINSGGKRLRPLLVLLSARACGYPRKDTEHHELAAIIEFVHTATLLHDDVVDTSELRRGKKTANALWGNQPSVLVGDFLYSRAFQILANRNNIPVMKCLADTTNAIAEGEVQQLMNQYDPDISENNYYRVIYHKTAKLFESSAEIGAMLAQKNQTIQKAMADYGLNLGMAFQITDDLLDYVSDAATLGKNIGDDLAEGKVTLPLIIAMQRGTAHQKALTRNAIQQGRLDDMPLILKALNETRAIEYTHEQARIYSDKALAALGALSDSPSRQSMEQLANFSINRSF